MTGAALRMTWLHFFEAGAILFGQIAKRIGTAVSSALNFEGSLAELVRFCQLRKMRKSRRIVLFLTLSSSKIKEVSQNCRVFDVVKFKN